MGYVIGLILIAAGAVLIWGVTGTASGIDIDAIGVILFVVGLLSILLDLLLFSSWGPAYGRRRRVVTEGPDAVERRYVEPRPARRVTTVEDEEVGPPPP
jgi:hypothetical protein